MKPESKFWKEVSAQVSIKQAEELYNFIDGITKYADHPVTVHEFNAQMILQKGNSQLYHFGGAGTPILFIPSLINKSYILDMPGNSLLQELSKHFSIYLIDWGVPSDEESEFSTDDYISKRIDVAVETIIEIEQKKPALAGYCMGGIFAMLYSAKYIDKVNKVITFGMPWDFNAKGFFKLGSDSLKSVFSNSNTIDPEFLKAVFYLNNFVLVNQKYNSFKESLSHEQTSIERWVNDGVPLSKKVFFEFIENLFQENSLCLYGKFQSELASYGLCSQTKVLAIIAKNDSVVSPESAEAIARCGSKVQVMELQTGHIGLVLKRREQIIEGIKRLVEDPF